MMATAIGPQKTLRDSGAQVELVAPDPASLQAFGPNLMDPSRRADSAKAGLAEGRAEADELRTIWNK